MTKILCKMLPRIMAVALTVACGDEEAVQSVAPLEVKVYGLDSFCSSGGPLPAIDKWRAIVARKTQEGVEVLQDKLFPGDAARLVLTSVPEGEDMELTLLGLPAPDPNDREAPLQPVLYGRASGITVSKDKVTQVSILETRYGDVSCPDPAKGELPKSAPNVLFPTATRLPDGKILIAGGFTKVTEKKDKFEIGQPTRQAWIFDPQTGVVKKTKGDMNAARGAHAAILLPNQGLVLLVGGAERMYREKKNTCFPWYFKKDTAGNVGYTYELYDPGKEIFIPWDSADWPDLVKDPTNPDKSVPTHTMTKEVKRVFPTLSLNQDGTVIVAGGGLWPSCNLKAHGESDPDYQIAEIYRPRKENYSGGFMDSHGALTMRAMRSGHAAVKVEVRDKLAVHLFWGGSEDKPYAEFYYESTGQLDGNFGVFKEAKWVNEYKTKLYFPSIVPLKDKHFLIAGGVESSSSGSLKEPSPGSAWLVKVTGDDQISFKAVKEGLGVGRYFHAAETFDDENVVVFGGFSSTIEGKDKTVFADTATGDLRFFNLKTNEFSKPASFEAALLPRAGMTMTPLASGCMLIAGGVDAPQLALDSEEGTTPPFMIEVFCPSITCPESLWESGCY